MENNNKQNISLKELFNILKWSTSFQLKHTRLEFLSYFFTDSLLYFRSILSTFFWARLIDSILLSINVGTISSDVVFWFSLSMFITTVSSLISFISGYFRNLLFTKIRIVIREEYSKKMISLGIQNIENPKITKLANLASMELGNQSYYIQQYVRLIGLFISAISSALILLTFIPAVIPIIILILIPKFFVEKHFLNKDYLLVYDNEELERSSYKSIGFLQSPDTLLEILLSNSQKFLLGKFKIYKDFIVKNKQKLFKDWYIISFFLDILTDLVSFGALLVLVDRAIKQIISIGDLAFQSNLVNKANSDLEQLIFSFSNIYEMSVRQKNVYDFFNLENEIQEGTSLPKLKIAPSLEFRNLSFKYPESKKYVFKNLNLTINPGEKIAIVGKNGSGKTTLVKLISKVYKINEGEILINNQNLNEIKSEDWFYNLGSLFQNFNKYHHLSVTDNIQVGNINRKLSKKELTNVLEATDSLDFVNEYPKKFEQILSETFTDGIRPSQGQWQKLAIARFFFRDAPVIIFDEPTAAIDAEAELKIFNNIYKHFDNKTVFIISHRFSTVKNADRIIVLEDGEIKEVGTHKELLALDGIYAKSFKMQAKGYE